MPGTDNSTRWNSVFIMINDLLNLREDCELYISRSLMSKTMKKDDKQKLEKYCTLPEEDWEYLLHLHAILYDFWELIVKMQGNLAKKLLADCPISAEIYGKPTSAKLKSRDSGDSVGFGGIR
jgi:hypothetical protein